LLRRANGETLYVGLQIETSSRLLVNNGLYPQKTSDATWYWVLPHLQLGLFTKTSSPRKFAECLYYNVGLPPILHILSRFIEFIRHMQLYSRTVIYSSYSHTNHIHSYILTIMHSYINTFAHQCIHNIYMISIPTWLRQSPKSCSIVSLQFGLYLSSCHAPISHKWIARKSSFFIKSVIPSVSSQEMSLINHFKWQVRTTGQLASYLLTFIICQVASPNNRTTGISLLSVNHFEWQVRTTE